MQDIQPSLDASANDFAHNIVEKISRNGEISTNCSDFSINERWFCTEEEARTAGWRKAKDCPNERN